MVVTSLTPDVIWHFKADDENAHVQLPGSFSEGMSALELVESPLAGVIVRGVIFVDALTLSLK